MFALSGVRIVYLTDWHGDGTAMPHRMAQPRRKLTRADSDRPGQSPDLSPRLRGVTYYRQSAKEQQKNSVAIQQELVQKWAKKNDVAIIREFTERGKTTKSARRR